MLLTLEASVSRVIFEHVDHVIQRDEGVIDSHNLGALGDGWPQDEAADATETVDTDL